MFKCLADVYERLQNNILILCSAELFMRLIGWEIKPENPLKMNTLLVDRNLNAITEL